MRIPARALVATLAIAAMTHVAVLWAAPRLIMGRTIAVMEGSARTTPPSIRRPQPIARGAS
jgi:hypothetical protein